MSNWQLLFATFVSVAAIVTAHSAERPHIVFIRADDLRWGDLGCYGHSQTKTPHLDQMAREGTLFA
jgi:arylsulfatase A-like enzyme